MKTTILDPVAPVRMAPELPTSRVAGSRTLGERLIKMFFGGNALVAIVVLALITLFLIREGAGFFGQNLRNIQLYRMSGLELVDIARGQAEAHSALSRGLTQVREQERRALAEQGYDDAAAMAALQPFDQFAEQFSDASEALNGLVSDAGETAQAFRAMMAGYGADPEESAGATGAEKPGVTTPPPPADPAALIEPLKVQMAAFDGVAQDVTTRVQASVAAAPQLRSTEAQRSLDKWKSLAADYVASYPAAAQQIREWDATAPVRWHQSLSAFLFGRQWVTASFWQDWYGIVPLFVGSLMVSVIALSIAVPFGVASAIYVSEIASKREKAIIKPYIEFIAAIPSVVLGFFGIAVVGTAIRALSEMPFFSWVPFFPLSERLNVFTAGSLLALMAVPTIFTLAEDALRNVPRGFKEASFALGANRLQTVARVLVPASLSGIISAILLGLGRVIGETMVVLLCAGNRIAIPDFTQGLGAFFQPVHTMTGIIAQEMGEVVRNSIHYRALFMVGLVLFCITLAINYLAQRFVARYRMSIG
jgi:phosphate transport system permease protein